MGGHRNKDQRRRHHSADGGGDGQGGTARVAQITRDELAVEFESDDEEEDGEQPVGGPLAQRQVQMKT